MAKKIETKEVEEVEEYLKYVVKDCTFNITIESGGTFILQTGKPTPPPTPPGGGQ